MNIKIHKDYNLSKLNTFGITARAKFFVEIHSEAELPELFNTPEFKNSEKLFLGSGSNVLFTKDFAGLVILNKLKGIEIKKENMKEDSGTVLVRCMGGEVWHDLVNFVVERDLWGIENLSLIPGTVGAAPMQNIGAYGAELKNVLENVEAYNIKDGTKKVFNKAECEFGYRDSVFKNKLKGKYFISAVTLKLSKMEKKNLGYKVLQEYLEKNKVEINGPKDISEAVAAIRRSKLPDPKIIGNAGSFFKNIFVSKEKLEEMTKIYPDMPHFEEGGVVKIPSAWLIEKAGWKGHRVGNVGVHSRQALVLVNHGGATGEEVQSFSLQIIASVKSKFGLELTPEVNLI